MKHSYSLNRRRSAFTAIELLVVIGIIVLLAGLLLPMIVKAFRSGGRARAAADLASIGVGLDAFKGDFGQYPAVETPGTGFAVLGKTMIGPYGDGMSGTANDDGDPPTLQPGKTYKPGECAQSGPNNRFLALVETDGSTTGDNTKWAPLGTTAQPWDCRDGFDGPGFRARVGGKVYGPYLAPGKFKTQGLAILDNFGQPILYFPANPVKINLSVPNTVYVGATPPFGNSANPMYNFADNGYLATSLTPEGGPNYGMARARMQAVMGAATNITGGPGSGVLASGETPVTSAPYLLWSCGPDQKFGPVTNLVNMTDVRDRRKAANDCDDVASFKQ